MGDPEFHEIEDQLFDAIVDSRYRAVIKNGNIYIPDPNGLPGEIILVDPAEPEDVDDPRVLNFDEDGARRIGSRNMWGEGRLPQKRDQNVAKKEKPSTQDEQNRVGSGETTSQPTPSLTKELLELKLSEGQRRTILKYAELPANLSERLAANRTVAKRTQLTLDELDELLDHLETSVYRAKGNEKQKVLRIVEKVSKLLGSTIDPDEISEQRLPKKMNTVFQIKVTLMGIAPLIWRRIQTQDCTLAEFHDLLQVTMGWEFEHLYRFIIGGVKYADLGMASQDNAQDACDTNLSRNSPGAEPPTPVRLRLVFCKVRLTPVELQHVHRVAPIW